MDQATLDPLIKGYNKTQKSFLKKHPNTCFF